MTRTKRIAGRIPVIIIGIFVLSIIVGTGSYLYLESSHSLNSSVVGDPVNVAPSIQTAFANGTIPVSKQLCANFSVSYKPLASVTTFFIGNPSVTSLTISISCNGCNGPQSDNQPYTTVAGDTSPQWNGTFGPFGNPVASSSVSGICDVNYGLTQPFGATVWQLSWSFQRLTPQGTLAVSVSFDNNQTVLFNRSAVGAVTKVSGSLTLPFQLAG
jgi:hypothetical protein